MLDDDAAAEPSLEIETGAAGAEADVMDLSSVELALVTADDTPVGEAEDDAAAAGCAVFLCVDVAFEVMRG